MLLDLSVAIEEIDKLKKEIEGNTLEMLSCESGSTITAVIDTLDELKKRIVKLDDDAFKSMAKSYGEDE